jgi:tetratricopeptide (TPR) repeat protein
MNAAVVSLIFLFALCVQAQESPGSAAAKVEFEKGTQAMRQNEYKKAAEFFRKAIELDPNYSEAHSRFISASKQEASDSVKSDLPEEERKKQSDLATDAREKELIALYEGWTQKDPKNPSYQWALGSLYMFKDYDKVEQYSLKAVSVDPKFVPAYETLSLIAQARGDNKNRADYLRKAMEAAPQDPSRMSRYAEAIQAEDPALSRKLMLELVSKFPKSGAAQGALADLARNADTLQEKIQYLERMKSLFIPDKSAISNYQTFLLFDAYSQAGDSSKAIALAKEMIGLFDEGNDKRNWQERLVYEEKKSEARGLVDQKKYTEAIALIDTIKVPARMRLTPYNLLKAETLSGTGQTNEAYNYLLKQVPGEPSNLLMSALSKYASALNKTPAQIRTDILQVFEKGAKPIKDFSLARYGDEKKISIADYRGKVVLLNFWYPLCGPCRLESPYIAKVKKEYADDKFVVLAVNVHSEEDRFALPFIKGNKYDFIPLRGSVEMAVKDYQARGFPTNFLIDTQGRVVARLPLVLKDQKESLEIQIQALLAGAK